MSNDEDGGVGILLGIRVECDVHMQQREMVQIMTNDPFLRCARFGATGEITNSE